MLLFFVFVFLLLLCHILFFFYSLSAFHCCLALQNTKGSVMNCWSFFFFFFFLMNCCQVKVSGWSLELGMEALPMWPDLGPVSWRPTTVKWRQSSQSNRHSTIGTGQTEYHEVLPSLANVQSHLTSSFTDDGNASWYSVCGGRWNDGWTVETVVTWRLSASVIPAPGSFSCVQGTVLQ